MFTLTGSQRCRDLVLSSVLSAHLPSGTVRCTSSWPACIVTGKVRSTRDTFSRMWRKCNVLWSRIDFPWTLCSTCHLDPVYNNPRRWPRGGGDDRVQTLFHALLLIPKPLFTPSMLQWISKARLELPVETTSGFPARGIPSMGDQNAVSILACG
ncbi:hypothetical protein BX600DRAFT_452816 [Xylariales sp. PMI_506]|nr:hypothetical protein BX600DRAFT_452816 [Xylariales sp. PMI_506]